MTTTTIEPERLNGHAPQTSAKVNDLGGTSAKVITPSVRDRPRRRANGTTVMFGAAIALAGLVVAVSFVLSYHGLFEFAFTVARLPRFFAVIMPIAIDLFSLVAMLCAFLNHHAPMRVRVYCWAIVGYTVLVSMAGNVVYALDLVGLIDQSAYWRLAGVAYAGQWPLLSGLSLHLIIVTRRQMQRVREQVEATARASEQLIEESIQNRAVLMALGGETVAEIALKLDRPDRTVANWTKAVRDGQAALAASAATAPTSPAPAGAARRTRTPKTT